MAGNGICVGKQKHLLRQAVGIYGRLGGAAGLSGVMVMWRKMTGCTYPAGRVLSFCARRLCAVSGIPMAVDLAPMR